MVGRGFTYGNGEVVGRSPRLGDLLKRDYGWWDGVVGRGFTYGNGEVVGRSPRFGDLLVGLVGATGRAEQVVEGLGRLLDAHVERADAQESARLLLLFF